jgi:hypothetical protein
MQTDGRSSERYLNPRRECDLVMKGGVTSGVVYPPAVLGLASEYRFRSIGGTSAGAIAAAATAAAEYGREWGGFDHLEQLSLLLAQPGMLFNLFQPTATTRPLFDTLFALVESWRQPAADRPTGLARDLTRALWQNTPDAFVRGAAAGAGGSLLLSLFTGGSVNLRSLAVAAASGWLGGIAAGSYELANVLLRELPQQNYYGLCTGRQITDTPEPTALTDWLGETINALAGLDRRGPPLTFAQLAEREQTQGRPSIDLRMVTANLSLSRPFVMPFETRTFLFKESEMRDFFPAHIVDTMIRYSQEHPARHVSLEQLPGYHWLPVGKALPVIVATRMSLSFPVLISAVPLYTIKRSAIKGSNQIVPRETDLQRNWFSDGAICSNFPIHFFDSWFPTRPTFGINLVSAPEQAFRVVPDKNEPEQQKQVLLADYQSIIDADNLQIGGYDLYGTDHAEVRSVYLPRADDPVFPIWQEMNGLLPFVNSIMHTSRSYRDTLQSQLLSYRDRIVQIRFEPHEGGLNLSMMADTIRNIQQKGATASEKICNYFQIEHHQWNRLLVLMELMERQLKDLQESIDQIGWERIEALFEQQRRNAEPNPDQTHFPFAHDDEVWVSDAVARIHAIYEFISHMKNLDLHRETPPPPAPVLRITPEI